MATSRKAPPADSRIGTVEIQPATADRLPDLAGLFGASGTTTGCYCMWFLIAAKQCHAGWSGGNRESFESLARSSPEPVGLLAYAGGEAVGWCAAGPLPRYQRALRSPTLKQRGLAGDPYVWLVPCFFVRRDARKQGGMRSLLGADVELARAPGARGGD